MAALTKTTAPGSYPVSLTTLTPLAMTQLTGGDASDDFAASGNDVVVVSNQSGGATTITVVSVADDFNRIGNIAVSVPAASYALIGPLKQKGWMNGSGRIAIQSSAAGAATITAGVIALP